MTFSAIKKIEVDGPETATIRLAMKPEEADNKLIGEHNDAGNYNKGFQAGFDYALKLLAETRKDVEKNIQEWTKNTSDTDEEEW